MIYYSKLQTSFSFDASEITTINNQINTQLGKPSSTTQVSLTNLKPHYPDSPVAHITSPSSFTVLSTNWKELLPLLTQLSLCPISMSRAPQETSLRSV